MKTLAVVGCALAVLIGCKSKPEPKAREVAAPVIRDTPSILRGTIGAEASLLKAEPVLVSGYGLVVGLPDTGGGDLDERLMATMERQLGLGGVSRSAEAFTGTELEGMTPQQILRSRKVAVVVVYAAVVPGAPAGTTFDVFVRAASGAPDLSLEGGLLWTTDLKVGPPTTMTGIQARRIAKAYGPVFINPFAEPDAREGFSRRDGRILGGGLVTAPLKLELIRDNESHSRATLMTRAINNRFTPDAGQEPVARGESSRLVTVTVPPVYRERSVEFLQLLLHMQIDQSMPQEYAKKYVEALKTQPYLGDQLSWCLQALPQKAALPFVRDLYDWPEMVPRLAALRAGAGLGDPLAVPGLKQLAEEGSSSVRVDAIRLMGRLGGPSVDGILREQMMSESLPVRVAAYEALASRAEAEQVQRFLAQRGSRPVAARVARATNDPNPAIFELSADSLQGVSRRVVEKKFILDIVPEGEPMVYIAQQGRPRIVLFGKDLSLNRPSMVSAWSDRLMLASDSPTDDVRVLYRTPGRRTSQGDVIPGPTAMGKVGADLPELIEFLAHQPTIEDPRSGLGMTYSQVVGALYAFHQGGAIKGVFAVEEDLLKARLLKAANAEVVPERPETEADGKTLKLFEPPAQTPKAEPVPTERPSLVKPLNPPPEKTDR